MSAVDWGEALRIWNFVNTAVLFVILGAATVWRWKRMDPVERLFSMSLTGRTIYILAATWVGIIMNVPFRWYIVVLTISNVWLTVTVVILALRKDPLEVTTPTELGYPSTEASTEPEANVEDERTRHDPTDGQQ